MRRRTTPVFKLFGDSDYHDTPSPSSKLEVTVKVQSAKLQLRTR